MGDKMDLAVDVVALKGTYEQVGFKQGQDWKRDERIEFTQEMTKHCDVNETKSRLMEYMPFLLEELKGVAAGLGMKEDMAIRMFSGFDVTFPQMGCTAFASETFYVRNYDFSPELYDARFVFCNPDDGYASVGFSQQMIGRLDGMNEKGLIVGLHLVNERHHRTGFLGTTIVRMILDQCATIQDAVHLLQNIPHGYCYNYSIMDRSGESVVIEASPNHQVVRSQNQVMCTNHFEMDVLRENNRPEISQSKTRLNHLEYLPKQKLTPLLAYQLFNEEESPFFFKDYQEYFGTMHTVVYDPMNLSVTVGIGGDCEPFEFSLKGWVVGDIELPNVINGVFDFSR